MSVVVDQKPLEAEHMGLKTVGQVLAHLQRDNRLVVHVLIDGQEPDLERMSAVRASRRRRESRCSATEWLRIEDIVSASGPRTTRDPSK